MHAGAPNFRRGGFHPESQESLYQKKELRYGRKTSILVAHDNPIFEIQRRKGKKDVGHFVHAIDAKNVLDKKTVFENLPCQIAEILRHDPEVLQRLFEIQNLERPSPLHTDKKPERPLPVIATGKKI